MLKYSLITLTLLSQVTFAQTTVNDLLLDMESISKSAKNQRANIDYIPYIMSVFDATDFSRAGASSLKDALGLVAGVNIASDNLGINNAIFHGSNPVAYGQTKLIIDGIEVNDLFFDGYAPYLSMPIEMIKRIEVVRGPGSYSDGHWGYAGSIIITTVKAAADDNTGTWFASLGTYNTHKAGATYTYAKGDRRFAIDAYMLSDDLSLTFGKDSLANDINGAPNPNASLSRSGKSPSQTKASMVSATFQQGDFFADARVSLYQHGSEGGINYALAALGDHYNIDQWFLRFGQNLHVGIFDGKVALSATQDGFTSYALLGPANILLETLSPPTAIRHPYGFYGHHEIFIRTYRAETSASATVGQGELTFGLKGSWSSVDKELTITTNRDTSLGLYDYSQSYPFIDPNGKIKTLTAYTTYEKELSTNWMGYASLTVDRRDDLRAQVDPRLAAVYTIDDKNFIKFSTSRSHRNPSWQELFTQKNKARWGNPDLRPETVWAYETQYIHHFGLDHTLSFNLFQLQNSDQIFLTTVNRYTNGSKSRISGLETEWQRRFSATTFYGSLTSIIARDSQDEALANAPTTLARGFVTHTFDSGVFASLAGRWQSPTPRAPSDPRSDMKAIGIIDLSTGAPLPLPFKSELQLTVKNLFDAIERYPSPTQTYTNDYPSMGRAFLMTLRGSF